MFLYKPRNNAFFQFEITINILVRSFASFEYLDVPVCYRSAITEILFLFQCGNDFRCQTSMEVDPRAERVNQDLLQKLMFSNV